MRARALKPDEQLKVLARVWDKGPDMDGWVFLPWILGSSKDKEQRRRNWNEGPAFKWPQDRDAILRHLETHKTDDLYFTPNTFLGESRVAQMTAEERVLFADLDEVDPTRDIDEDLRPTIAWETSPGRFQGVWLLSDFADGATDPGGLNQRLTAMLGADPSGWDTTQLLRVPGRRNFKPGYRDDDGDSPPGRLLWILDRTYDVGALDSRLPHVEVYGAGLDASDEEIDAVNAKEAWYRVRIRVSENVRAYMKMKSHRITEEFDRSEVLWQIERDLADAGCTLAEIVAIVRATPWNKHAQRNNELAQLKAEAAKALGISEKNAAEETLEDDAAPSRSRPEQPIWVSEILARPRVRPRWLVNRVWTRGSCGFIAAEPKSYKSYFALDLAISVATGKKFLNDPQYGCTQAPVLFISEEDPESLVMHRYDQILEGKAPERFWAGQLSTEHVTRGHALPNGEGLFWAPPTHAVPIAMHIRTGFKASDPIDQAWLVETLIEYGIKMVVIDTLGTTIGDLDINDAPKLYPRVLNPLKEISNQADAAIVIVHHNRKNGGDGRRGQQMVGSQAFHAWTESALYLSKGEHVTGQPAEVKVERENKLAEDLKFRVRIPVMYQDKGEGDGSRQLWAPEVWPGWGDAEPADQAEIDKPSRAGGPLVRMLTEMGAIDEPVSFEAMVAHSKKAPGNLRGEINRNRGLVSGTFEKGFRLK